MTIFFRIHKFLCLFALWLAPLLASTNEPAQITFKADSNTAFEGGAHLQGNVTVRYGSILLFCDSLYYFKEENRLEAEGNIHLDTPQARIDGQSLQLDLNSGQYTITEAKVAAPPLYFTGASATGSRQDITLSQATAYYLEPDPYSPQISAQSITYQEDGRIQAEKAVTRVGILPLFYLPSLDYHMQATGSPLRYKGKIGYDGDLGLFSQSDILYQIAPNWRVGGSFDLYSSRGVLIGPAFDYHQESASRYTYSQLRSGYIHDQGNTKEDLLGQNIDPDRGFIAFQFKHYDLDSPLQLTADLHYWADSEILRDFRQDLFNRDQTPFSFLEANYRQDNWLLTAYSSAVLNNFYEQQEQLPLLQIDYLTQQLGATPLYHHGFLQFSQNESNPIDNTASIDNDRFDAYYGWLHQHSLRPWLHLTTQVGSRITHYLDGQNNSGSYTRLLGEIGFDLSMDYQATWDLQHEFLAIDQLRHRAQPILQYRWIPQADQGQARIPVVNQLGFQNYPTIINLADQRNSDALNETHLIRLGHRNTLETKDPSYGSRTLAYLDFYQDIRFDDQKTDTLANSYTALGIHPTPWLSWENFFNLETANLTLIEMENRLTISPAEDWSASLSTTTLQHEIDQYQLAGHYRLSFRTDLLAQWEFDARSQELIRQAYGIRQKLGNAWEYGLTFSWNQGSSREDDLRIRLRIKLLQF